MKKLAAFILALVMIFALTACTGGKQQTVANSDSLTKNDVIKLVTVSSSSWPYREDWKVWDYIEEGSGVTLDVTAILTDPDTKYSIMFASPETLADVVAFTSKPGTDGYAIQGALIPFEDVAEHMPNYNAWVKTLSEEDYANNVAARKSYDGKIYYSPVIGRELSQNVRAWLYRKDIFEKHNLKIPATFDELYDVCKELKAIYPDSYPFSLRSAFNHINGSGPSWKEYWTAEFYYDFNEGKWCYGAIEDTMRDVTEFYKKMVSEKLMPSDFMTIDNTTWQELITTDRGFIFPDYQTRIDFFNSIARKAKPSFDLKAMVPPVADAENGVPMVNKYNVDPTGVVICNTGDEGKIATAAKFVDWLYTDEAYELLSWGKEGETYEIVDGKKKYILDDAGTQANTLYGFGTYGTFVRMDPDAILAFESEDISAGRDMVIEHTMPYANPTLYLAFNEEENKFIDDYKPALVSYTNEMFTKFILNQEPISNFDSFVETLKRDFYVDELLEVYESAYARIK